MRALRVFLFLLSITLGLGAGLLYGWVLNPPPYSDLPLSSLREDFKADYVLMVAEIYHQDGNLPQAVKRLNTLNPTLPPARSVAEALLTARDLDYHPLDLELLSELARAVQTAAPEGATPSPESTLTAPEGTP